MYKTRTLTFLGLIISIMPYLGFPYFFKNLFISILGLSIAYIAGMTWYQNNQKSTVTQIFENFSENKNFLENN